VQHQTQAISGWTCQSKSKQLQMTLLMRFFIVSFVTQGQSLFVFCLLPNGTSAQYRLLVPRRVKLKQTRHVKTDLKTKMLLKRFETEMFNKVDYATFNEHKQYANGKKLE